MAANIHAITVHLGLRRPAIAGISMGRTIALQYALDHPGDVCRLVLVDSFPGIPAEYTAERDRQLAFIETHGLREIAEERMALAFTASADPGTKAWVTEMIASGDLRDTGTRPGPRSASTPGTGSENSSSRSPSSTGSSTRPSPAPSPPAWARRSLALPSTSSKARAISLCWKPPSASTRCWPAPCGSPPTSSPVR